MESSITRSPPTPQKEPPSRPPESAVTRPNFDALGLLDASPNSYLILDRALYIIGANKAYLAATKRTLADIVGRWAWDAFPTDPATLQQAMASFERVIRTGQPDTMPLLRFDIPCTDAAGGFETRYWSISHTPVLDDNGEVAAVLQHPIDVTELERLRNVASITDIAPAHALAPALNGIITRAQNVYETNLMLKADSDRLRDLFMQAPSPVAVLAGEQHVVEMANEGIYQIVGRRDLIGQPIRYALPELATQGFVALLDEVFHTGKPFIGHNLKVLLQRHPDQPPAEVYHDVLYQPLFGAQHTVTGIFCQINEVTHAYHAQVALRESQERLQQGMEAARMVVWSRDLRSGQLMLSDNAVDIIGGTWHSAEAMFQAVHPDDAQKLHAARLQATPEQPHYGMEFRFIRPDNGKTIWLENRAQVLFDATGAQVQVKGVTLDITERKCAEEQLRAQTEKLQIAAEAAELGMFDYDLVTGEGLWNARNYEHFGVSPDVNITRDVFLACVHPDDRAGLAETLNTLFALRGDSRYQAEYRVIGTHDEERWIAAKGRVFYDNAGQATRFIGTTMDVTERKRAEQQLRNAMQHDSLTGLPNRALLYEHCTRILAMAERANTNGAVLFVDLDRFKAVNDLYGHDMGDKVLREVARRLLAATRKGDIVSRLGGDEFIVVLPTIGSPRDPATVAQHILAAIGAPIAIGTLQLSVSPSVGISLFPEHGHDLEHLIHNADLAMYAAKKAGRNNVKTYTAGLDDQAHALLRLEMQLKQALECNGFALYYQPIIDISSMRLTGAEALIRMVADDGTLLSPNDFIPIAEAAGLIDRVGEWVVREACRQHQAWRASGLPPVSIAINVSSLQFRQPAFIATLASAIAGSGMDPSWLQIEVTESTIMDDLPATVAKLHHLQAMGIRISLDDFGTGYSSLSYLSSLPLDKLKIDRSFIDKMASSQRSRSITEAIIVLGRTLNLKVVGEGIETEESMNFLREFGCDQAQGFLFSAPLAADEFASWCRMH